MEFKEKWSVKCGVCQHKLTSEKNVCARCNSGKVKMNRYVSRHGYTRVSFGCSLCKMEAKEIMSCPECMTAVDIAASARKAPSFFERLFMAH